MGRMMNPFDKLKYIKFAVLHRAGRHWKVKVGMKMKGMIEEVEGEHLHLEREREKERERERVRVRGEGRKGEGEGEGRKGRGREGETDKAI